MQIDSKSPPNTSFTPPAWMADAACIEHADLAWFPSPGCGARRITAAKTICGRCLVRDDCLDYALTERITAGIWGGTTPNERKRLEVESSPTRYSGDHQ